MPNDPILPIATTTRSSRLGARRISSVRSDDPLHLPLPNLSDKAKGKRRATDPDDHQNDDEDRTSGKGKSKVEPVEEERGRSITFRFTGEAVDSGDLDVWVDAGESVGRVKDKVCVDWYQHISIRTSSDHAHHRELPSLDTVLCPTNHRSSPSAHHSKTTPSSSSTLVDS